MQKIFVFVFAYLCFVGTESKHMANKVFRYYFPKISICKEKELKIFIFFTVQSIAPRVQSFAQSAFYTIFEKIHYANRFAQSENLKKSAISSLSNFGSNFSLIFERIIINSKFASKNQLSNYH